MRFFVFKDDFDAHNNKKEEDGFSIDQSTSVIQHKKHFFEALRNLGEIIFLDNRISYIKVRDIFEKPDAIFARMHGVVDSPGWNAIPKRILSHSLGDLLLPEGYQDPVIFSENTVNIVTSAFQAKRIKDNLAKATPRLAVFTPKLNENDFYLSSSKERAVERKKLGLSNNDIHIVYAGRWLATKGITQLLRALTLWPDKRIKVSLAGNFEPNFPIRQMSASHFTYASYFKREFLENKLMPTVYLGGAKTPAQLRELFWSADLVVYTSVHEDENFGMVPREAALCGVPVVVTDFCGLNPIGQQMPWGCVNTYSAFNGPRYSIFELRKALDAAIEKKNWDPQSAAKSVKKECSPVTAQANLKRAARSLLAKPLVKPLESKAARQKILFDLLRYADEKIPLAFAHNDPQAPDGAFVDGTGFYNCHFPYQGFLRAVQGFYTTHNEPPKVLRGSTYRGFSRIALWSQERAVVEFGFPGPRVKHYGDKDWRTLVSCAQNDKTGDIVLRPNRSDQIHFVQQLIDLGYLVPDR